MAGNICLRKTFDRSEDVILQYIHCNKLGLLEIDVHIYILHLCSFCEDLKKINCYTGLSLFLFLTL